VLLVRERGKGVALRAGFRAATGDVVVAMDADGSTDPVEIPAFVGMLVAGADVALGSRFAVGGGTDDMDRLRAVGNWMLTRFVRFAFRARYSDLCYGFFAFWRDVLPDLDGSFVGFEVETVVHIRALKAGLRVAEVPSYEARRLSGQSNLRTFPDGFRILRAIIAEYRSAKRVPPTSLGRSVRAALWQSSEMSAGGEELSV
jgi:glycosyltransferase involved in cell wall biosynthesis